MSRSSWGGFIHMMTAAMQVRSSASPSRSSGSAPPLLAGFAAAAPHPNGFPAGRRRSLTHTQASRVAVPRHPTGRLHPPVLDKAEMIGTELPHCLTITNPKTWPGAPPLPIGTQHDQTRTASGGCGDPRTRGVVLRKQHLKRSLGHNSASECEHHDTGEPATPAESAIPRPRAGHHDHDRRERLRPDALRCQQASHLHLGE